MQPGSRVMLPQAKDRGRCWQPPEAGREASGGTSPADTSISDFWSLEPRPFLLPRSPVCVTAAPGRKHMPTPSPEDLPDPGIEPGSPALQADSLPTEVSGSPQ